MAEDMRDEPQEKTPTKKQTPQAPDTVTVMHSRNGTKEFAIGREWYRFGPYEVKEIPRAVLDHPDFLQQKSYFAIKGE